MGKEDDDSFYKIHVDRDFAPVLKVNCPEFYRSEKKLVLCNN